MSLSDRAERVAEVVEAAMEREPAEQEAFVAEACGGDDSLRAEVDSLLRFSGEAAAFIEQPAVQANAELFAGEDDNLLTIGQTIEHYRILSLLGAGGMGEVYLADDLSLGRKVALKLVKGAFGGRELLRHFRQEERILAALEHPNIARLYGGGVMDNRVPYFVMEYVEGERLDTWCDVRQLSLTDRLQLFRKICAAVAYAHQHLVIHRDLKPANIRVTPEGEPKLLDFGIAKLLDADAAATVDNTVTLVRVMTPDYASPEQVRGETMSTASDVYSLGVVLYELLSGQKPYRLTSHRAEEVSRAITDQIPLRLSAALAANPKSKPENRKFLRGDLDNIVLMAMRKEPDRRYGSVALLAEDIRRHLEGLPVTARRDTWRYRSGKFVQRHKAAVFGAAIVILALIGGIVATSWEARIARLERARAEQRFNDVRKLANSYLFEFHDAIENLPGSTPARALLVQRALEYLDGLAGEAGSDLSLKRELVMAYLKVGNVQGNPQNANLGDAAGALESYRKAQAIADKWPASDAQQIRRPLALIYEKTADVLAASNQVPEAVESARHSLALFKELAAAQPTDSAAQLSVAISLLKVGDVLGSPKFVSAGDHDGALKNYCEALAILDALHAADAANVKVRRFLGMIHERIGGVLESLPDPAGAQAAYERSAAIRVPLAAEFPNDTTIVRDGAVAYEKLGDVMTVEGDLQKALEHRRRSLAMFQNLLQADPQNAVAQHSLGVSYIRLADLFGAPDAANLNRRDDALENYQRAVVLLEGVLRGDRSNAAVARDLAEAQSKIQALNSAPSPR